MEEEVITMAAEDIMGAEGMAEEIREAAVIEREEEMVVVEAEAGLAERNWMRILSGEQASCCKYPVVHVSVGSVTTLCFDTLSSLPEVCNFCRARCIRLAVVRNSLRRKLLTWQHGYTRQSLAYHSLRKQTQMLFSIFRMVVCSSPYCRS
jgi:hypothetical protein